MDTEREIARFFDCCETPRQRKSTRGMSSAARRELVRGVTSLGLEGRSVLEVGSGHGELTVELVRLGAERAVGIDLAPRTVAEARQSVAEKGLADRVEFRVGNAATEELEMADVVVLDRVICCYPDWRQLVANTSSAARSAYAFVIPRSTGFTAPFLRAAMWLVRLSLRVRRCGFRPFVHDQQAIHHYLLSSGFVRTHADFGAIWVGSVYSRT